MHQMLQKRISDYFIVFILFTHFCLSQSHIDENKVFLITLDGLRWQELFSGADSLLVKNKKYVKQMFHSCFIKNLYKNCFICFMRFVDIGLAARSQLLGGFPKEKDMRLTQCYVGKCSHRKVWKNILKEASTVKISED